jgi:NAD(P)-dependent dehydrogenase (short-subunit alcohol dehydrogenase family)
LEGKVAIVTGGGSRGPGIGNGRAAAVLFAREGARVAVLDRDANAAAETRRMIDAEGGDAIEVLADVSEEASCRAAVEEVVRRWGAIHILVNNVGITGPAGNAVEVELDSWDRALRVNLTSMVLMAKQVVPIMVTAGGGSIINISSIAGLLGGGALLYATAKGGIISLTRSMAAAYGRQAIRVNCVAPGLVYTPMVQEGMTPEQREARRLRTLLQTEGTGWDVGHAVLFLASDEARWITGVTLPVDGGATASLNAPQPSAT